ncbi:MAG: alanine dehydrogenase [Alphaproteobacteria bacterium]|nr:alanine dehydrogenase [Alphaproteobacteria bacterium]MBU6473292.1 alanine dehydrogenase [Alphaproteobacteria bacterium]
MHIGVPKEIKTREYRVGLTPASVAELTRLGHAVTVETQAGAGISLDDDQYRAAGAKIAKTADEIFAEAELIVKVKEPQLPECAKLKPHHTLFTYLHLAADKPQAEALCRSGCRAIAYETVTSPKGHLPLLQPMSEVAGRMSIQVGAHALEKTAGGRGLLLGGVPGVAPAKVVILGGGVAGENALQMAIGVRADVTLFEKSIARITELDTLYGKDARILYSTGAAVREAVLDADLVIGAVLIPGAAAPKLVTRAMLKEMKPGAALVDIAIDQGGCFETSHPTTHDDPTYEVDGIVHYCVANMPGGVARTSTFALNNATLPFTIALAQKGTDRALAEDPHLMNGLNIANGKVVLKVVADAIDMPYTAYTPAA